MIIKELLGTFCLLVIAQTRLADLGLHALSGEIHNLCVGTEYLVRPYLEKLLPSGQIDSDAGQGALFTRIKIASLRHNE